LIAALLQTAGAKLVRQARCGDEAGALEKCIQEMPAETWDLLLISGGASVGDYDFGPETLRRLGFEIHFGKVNLRPGKPLALASRGRQLAFVIPGNPVSHFILFHVAIRAALDALEGTLPTWQLVHLPLGAPLTNSAGPRETFWPARLENGAVHPLRWQSSGDLAGIAGANAILPIPPHTGHLAAGAQVPCLLLP
jgi:molybdopterin molybdotransferase